VALNRGLVGKSYEDSYEVTAEAIEAYARATNDDNERYLGRDAVASPVWPVVPAFALFMTAAKDPELGADFVHLLHAAEEHVLGPPIRPGDRLGVTAVIQSIEPSPAGEAFTVMATERNGRGEVVAEVAGTMVVRGSGPRQRPSGPRPRPEAPGEVVYEESTIVADDQMQRYASASGDTNPIHLDDEAARLARLPGVILHGMCTMAFAAKAAVNGLAGGDPTRVRRISVAFSKPVFRGQELTTKLWPIDEPGEGRLYGFSTHQPAGVAVLTGGRVAIEEVE
jgi:(3R)-3-hydroxyacyl-CoA dehydrogenase / 3a,7a,12a-trihydroxy-5b-cholest-24-enoyl-CoA hydratase / enoyl-CoA hydratase 2